MQQQHIQTLTSRVLRGVTLPDANVLRDADRAGSRLTRLLFSSYLPCFGTSQLPTRPRLLLSPLNVLELPTMAPRKRLRPNPAEASSASLPVTMPASESTSQSTFRTESSATTEPTVSSPVRQGSGTGVPSSHPNLAKEVHRTRSWYGSWPRLPKSSASTQLARENILGGTLQPASAPDFTRFESKKPALDEASGSAEATQPTESTAIDAPKPDDGSRMDVDEAPQPASQPAPTEPQTNDLNKASDSMAGDVPMPETPQRPSTSSGWFDGWFGRSPAPSIALQSEERVAETPTAPNTAQPSMKEQEDSKSRESPKAQVPEDSAKPEPPQSPEMIAPVEATPKPRATSWFGIWSTNETIRTQKPGDDDASTAANPEQAKESEDVVMQDAPPSNPPGPAPTPAAGPTAPPTEPEVPHPPPAGSTWVFWSRASRSKSSGTSTPQPEDGELAVAGEESATHPQHATSQDIQETPPKDKKDKKKSKHDEGVSTPRPIRGKNNKRLRPQSMDIDTPTPSPPQSSSLKSDRDPVLTKMDKSPPKAASSKAEPSPKLSPSKAPPSKATASKDADPKAVPVSSSSKALQPNLLLPSFKSTYRMKENPSILQQIAEFLLRTKQPPTKHVFRSKDAPKIKNAISIGVHGLFPAKYITPLIGAPTGTSLRFASLGAEAIRRWADENGSSDCEIEKVCLEGEGRIAERVDNLWKLLLNWIDHLRKADLIIISSHSQGVPVSVMLLAKLIDMGIISEARVGVCAMGKLISAEYLGTKLTCSQLAYHWGRSQTTSPAWGC
jgi:hypothetical protein